MTLNSPAAPATEPARLEIAAALLVLERMGLSPADLLSVPRDQPTAPTFAEYVPVVAAAVTPGTRRPTDHTGTASSTIGATAA